MKGERCQDGLYRLSRSIVTNIPLASMGSQKWSAWNSQCWYKISFKDVVKKGDVSFQVANNGEGFYMIREDG